MFVRRVYSSISQVLQDKSFSESLWLLWKELLFKRQTSRVLKNNDISLIYKLKHVHTIIVFFVDTFNGKVERLKISLLDYQETICLLKITICIVGQSLLNLHVCRNEMTLTQEVVHSFLKKKDKQKMEYIW